MAITRTQAYTPVTASTGSSIAITVPAAGSPIGAVLALHVAFNGTTTVSSIVDTGANTWTIAGSSAASGVGRAVWYTSKLTTALTTGQTITVNFAGAITQAVISVVQFAGFTTGPFVDSQNISTTSVTTLVGSLKPIQANCVLVCAVTEPTVAAAAWNNAPTRATVDANVTTVLKIYACDVIQTTSTLLSPWSGADEASTTQIFSNIVALSLTAPPSFSNIRLGPPPGIGLAPMSFHSGVDAQSFQMGEARILQGPTNGAGSFQSIPPGGIFKSPNTGLGVPQPLPTGQVAFRADPNSILVFFPPGLFMPWNLPVALPTDGVIASGGASNPISISATQAQAGTVQLNTGHLLSATQAQAATALFAKTDTSAYLSLVPPGFLFPGFPNGSLPPFDNTQATGANNFPIAVSATQAQSGSLLRNVALFLAGGATQAQAGSILRGVSHLLASTQAQSGTISFAKTDTSAYLSLAPPGFLFPSFPTGWQPPFDNTQPTGANNFPIAVSATQSQVGSVALGVGHLLAATQAQLGAASFAKTDTSAYLSLTPPGFLFPSFPNGYQLPFNPFQNATIAVSATQAQAGSLSRHVGFFLSGGATQAQLGAILRGVGHLLAATQPQSGLASFAKTDTSAYLSLAPPGFLFPSFPTGWQPDFNNTQAPTGVDNPVNVQATQAQAASVSRNVSHLLAGSQAQAATALFAKTDTSAYLSLTPPGFLFPSFPTGWQAPFDNTQAGGPVDHPVNVQATQAQVASVARAILHLLGASQSQAGSVARSVVHLLAGTQGQSGTVARSVGHLLATTQPQSGAILRGVTHLLTAPQAQAGSLARAITHSLSAVQAQPISFSFTTTGTIVPISIGAILGYDALNIYSNLGSLDT